jgi:hypothetical protein
MAKACACDRTAGTVDLGASADGIQALVAITQCLEHRGQAVFLLVWNTAGAHVLNCRSFNAG